jgi:DNA-binding NtrC family response regulator
VSVTTPRLAERRDDIAGLWQRLLPASVRARPVSADVIEALLIHDWPRNVRELRRLAERMAVLHADGERWELADLDSELGDLLARRRRGEPPSGPTASPETGDEERTKARDARRDAAVAPDAAEPAAGASDPDADADAADDADPAADADAADAAAADDADAAPDERGPMARDELLALLDACGGRVADVARRAHRNRKQIYRWMDAYGIARGTGRKPRG